MPLLSCTEDLIKVRVLSVVVVCYSCTEPCSVLQCIRNHSLSVRKLGGGTGMDDDESRLDHCNSAAPLVPGPAARVVRPEEMGVCMVEKPECERRSSMTPGPTSRYGSLWSSTPPEK